MTESEALGTFSSNYATARDRFRLAAARAGWTVATHAIGGTGPAGEPLTIDVATSPSISSPDHTFILSSGLHGVEGHFGSAAQLAAIDTLAAEVTMSRRTRCVFVHALNPFGFAWSRRADADNVDLNRAFRLQTPPAPDSDAAYRRLDRFLNPQYPPTKSDAFLIRLLWAALSRGHSTLRRAIVCGQRVNPKGLFFAGGAARSGLQMFLERELPVWIGGAPTVVHLDLHTGLGRPGEPTLIVDYPPSEGSRSWMREAYGASRVHESRLDPKAYTAYGSLGQWCVETMKMPRYRFAFAEFGTVAGPRVLAALRAENQAHYWATSSDPVVAIAKAHLRDVFCPPDVAWRAKGIRGVLDLIRRTLGHLSADPRGGSGI